MATQKLLLGHVKGDKGDPGDKGDNGITPKLTVKAETTTDGTASVEQTGQTGDITLTFKIPKGEKGDKGQQGDPGKAPTWTKKEVTLAPATWTGSGPYTYTISDLTGLTATGLVFVHNAMSLTAAQINAFADACITAKSQAAGSIVLQAINKPTIELPIVIEYGMEATGENG